MTSQDCADPDDSGWLFEGSAVYCSTSHGAAPGTVLIVDDDRDMRMLMRFILEDLEYTVCEASDGREGLRALRAGGAGRLIVLLDYQMPHMDGWELLRAVAADAALAGRCAFVLVTANAEVLPAAFRALLAERAIPVLAKPFHLDDLTALVLQCAARAAGADEAPPA